VFQEILKVETPIGRCSLCQGTVVKETGAWMGTQPPRARCTSCGATEAPPARVIEMEKPKGKDLQVDLQKAFAEQVAKQQQKRLEDAVANERFLPKPDLSLVYRPSCRCWEIPVGQRNAVVQVELPQGATFGQFSIADQSQYCQPGQTTGIPQSQQNWGGDFASHL
jgi:hypothetical protein